MVHIHNPISFSHLDWGEPLTLCCGTQGSAGESRQALGLNHSGLPTMALLTSNENETNTHSGESVPEEHILGDILIPLPGAGLRCRNWGWVRRNYLLRITHSSNVISLFSQSGTQEPSPHFAKLTAINKTVLLPHSSSKTGLTAPLCRTRKQKPNTWGQDLPRIAEQRNRPWALTLLIMPTLHLGSSLMLSRLCSLSSWQGLIPI